MGPTVKQARLSAGWSIRDACAKAGVSTTTWINAEKGMRISPLSRQSIASALGWPDGAVDRLLQGQPVETDASGSDYNSRIAKISSGARDAIEAIIQAEERKLDP